MHRRFLTLPITFTVITPIILFSPIIFTGKALFWGIPSTQFIPWWSLAWGYIRDGRAPLWNPYSGMGAPLLANYQSAIFYPPHWFFLIMDSLGGIAWMAWAQAILVTAHLIWSGIGMVLFCRRMGLGDVAQTIGGLTFGMSNYLVARAGFLTINASAAWLPWTMVAVTDIIGLYRGTQQDSIPVGRFEPQSISWPVRVKRYGLFSLYLGLLLLAGHAQTTWYILVLVFSWAGYLVYSAGMRKNVIRAAPALILSAIFGVSLAAVQLIPTTEYLLQSQRASAVDYELAMSYSFWPWHALNFIAPGLFGNPAHGDYWGYGNYWEDAVYIGLLPIILAFIAMRDWLREKSKNIYTSPKGFFVILTAIAVLLALGRNTPIFPWLYKNIPTFDMFQAPARWMFLAVFSLAVLAAYGADQWRRPTDKGLYWIRLSLMGSVAVVVGSILGSWSTTFAEIDIKSSLTTASLLAGIWGFGSGVLTLFAPEGSGLEAQQMSKLPVWQCAVGIWVAADLIVAGWGLNPGISVDFYTRKIPGVENQEALFSEGRLYLSREDEEYLKFRRFFRFDTFDPFQEGGSWFDLRASLLPNLNLIDRIASANNFDPLVPFRYSKWLSAVEESEGKRKENLLKLMNVSVIEKVSKHETNEVEFIPLEPARRIRWIPCAIRVDSGEEVLEKVSSSDLDFDNIILLEGGNREKQEACSRMNDANLVALIVETHDIKVAINTKSHGYLFIADTWYPGWRAYIDGESVEILRANYLFRAIQVNAGHHEIEMVYKPVGYYVGASFSGVAWSILILGMLFATRRDNIR